MNEKYQPIACGLYDRLEELATLRKECEIVYLDEGNQECKLTDRITGLKSFQGAEYLSTSTGTTIRLDKLISVNGIPFRHAAC